MAHLTPAVRRVLFGSAAAFALLVAFRVHGFSLPIWHDLIDGSPADEILLGEPRFIRADDWAAQLPMSLAQGLHEPAFPIVNRNIGTGQNMLVPFPLPVAHFVSLFRPTLWGFFLGPDVGLAWMWWSQLLGLFSIWFGVLLVVTKNRFALALAGSALLTFSPFFQFYSLNAAPVAAFSGLCFLATAGLATATRPHAMIGWGLVLGWAGGAFALTLYPPYIVLLAYLYVALTLGFLMDAWPSLDLRRHGAVRGIALALAAAIALGSVGWYITDATDVIATMRSTEYPGARIETGGSGGWVQYVTANLFTALRIDEYRPIGNICGTASFWLFAPVVLAFILWQRTVRGVRVDRMLSMLFVYLVGVLWYRHVGFSEPVANASLFSTVLVKRTVIGIGLADALIVLRYLALDTASAGRGQAAAFSAVAAAGLVAGGVALHATIPEIAWPATGALIALNSVVAFGLLTRWRPAALVAGLAALMAFNTLWFNPLVRGGSAAIAATPLATAITAIDARHGGKTVWVTYGDPRIPNLFRMLGVHALDGLHTSPHFDLWRTFDPDGSRRAVYNRYAQVRFRLPEENANLKVIPPWSVYVNFGPEAPELRQAGVTHILVADPVRLADRRFWDRFETSTRSDGFRIYELPLRPLPR